MDCAACKIRSRLPHMVRRLVLPDQAGPPAVRAGIGAGRESRSGGFARLVPRGRRRRQQKRNPNPRRDSNERGRAMTDAPHFQQAEKSTKRSQFLQIVAKPDRATDRKSKAKSEQKLTRVTFRVSRLMEFCTQRELQNQTGHAVYDWPLVVLKELMDNALDACEEAEIAPVIEIAVGDGSIIIQHNGGGIATDTIKSILDYSIRVSSREAYVSPTRGAQGNALKTILAMGYVLDRERENADGINNDALGVTF